MPRWAKKEVAPVAEEAEVEEKSIQHGHKGIILETLKELLETKQRIEEAIASLERL